VDKRHAWSHVAGGVPCLSNSTSCAVAAADSVHSSLMDNMDEQSGTAKRPLAKSDPFDLFCCEGACSATACIIVLDREDLQAANLGDSGFEVIETARLSFRSPPQQHDFDFPFQLGPPGLSYLRMLRYRSPLFPNFIQNEGLVWVLKVGRRRRKS